MAAALNQKLPALGVPTHLVWGDADEVFPFDGALRWASRIPGSTLDLIPGAGHYIQEDATAECASAVLRRATEKTTSTDS